MLEMCETHTRTDTHTHTHTDHHVNCLLLLFSYNQYRKRATESNDTVQY